MGRRQGRGRLTAIEQLPPECDGIITWASAELRKRQRTQTEIYEDFFTRLDALKREYRGELDFVIPSFSAFNRHSIQLAAMTRRLEQTTAITSALAKNRDPKASDDLATIAADSITTLVFELLRDAGESGLEPREVKDLGAALRSAMQAQSVSTGRRVKADKQFKIQVDGAVNAVAKIKGLTAETAEAIKAQILGVGK